MSALALLTPAHLTALAKLIAGLPVADLAALLSGTVTADTVLDLAEQATCLIAAAFPPGALIAGEVGFALQALQWLLDASGAGGDVVAGGDLADASRPGGGSGPYRGR